MAGPAASGAWRGLRGACLGGAEPLDRGTRRRSRRGSGSTSRTDHELTTPGASPHEERPSRETAWVSPRRQRKAMSVAARCSDETPTPVRASPREGRWPSLAERERRPRSRRRSEGARSPGHVTAEAMFIP